MHVLKLKKAEGFTLIELMVAIAIGMVVLAGVTTTFMSQIKFYTAQEQVNEMEQNARGALDVITRELKMAGYKPNGGTVTGVTYNTSQLMIEADVDGSGVIDNTNDSTIERIIYAFNSANKQITRKMGSGGTVQVLADNITAFDVAYLKTDGVTNAAASSEVRQVKLDITARTAKPDPNYSNNYGYRTYTVTATITPPNLAL
jgi:type IV pilus assembly protein PilW